MMKYQESVILYSNTGQDSQCKMKTSQKKGRNEVSPMTDSAYCLWYFQATLQGGESPPQTWQSHYIKKSENQSSGKWKKLEFSGMNIRKDKVSQREQECTRELPSRLIRLRSDLCTCEKILLRLEKEDEKGSQRAISWIMSRGHTSHGRVHSHKLEWEDLITHGPLGRVFKRHFLSSSIILL